MGIEYGLLRCRDPLASEVALDGQPIGKVLQCYEAGRHREYEGRLIGESFAAVQDLARCGDARQTRSRQDVSQRKGSQAAGANPEKLWLDRNPDIKPEVQQYAFEPPKQHTAAGEGGEKWPG